MTAIKHAGQAVSAPVSHYDGQHIVEVRTKQTVRITVSWFKTRCQNNGNESTSVKFLRKKSNNQRHPTAVRFSSMYYLPP